MFDGVTYAKGACVLHELRGLLGDHVWWQGIRAYAARHKFQVVETDDFRKAMEKASGKDLKWFFDQWVYKAGHPELKVRWHFEDTDKTVRVLVQQVQKVDEQTPLFRLPTTLEISDDVGKTRRLDSDRRGLAGVCHPGGGEAQDGRDRPPRLVDQAARLPEKTDEEKLFSARTRGGVRAGPARGRAGTRQDGSKGHPEVARALAAASKAARNRLPAQRVRCARSSVMANKRSGRCVDRGRQGASEARVRVAGLSTALPSSARR